MSFQPLLPDRARLANDFALTTFDEIEPSVDDSNHGYVVTYRDDSDATRAWAPMSCPGPGAWSVSGESTVRGTTFYPISSVYGPSQADVQITLRSDRTVSRTYSIEGGVGWNIGVLEAQTHAKLDGTITTSMSESQQFLVRKGMSVYLAAQFIYRQSELRRTAYAGPNCQPTYQSLTVLTPINVAVLVARAVA